MGTKEISAIMTGSRKPSPTAAATTNPAATGTPQVFITITPKGGICAWGLERDPEELILALTGNHKLLTEHRGMAYELCG